MVEGRGMWAFAGVLSADPYDYWCFCFFARGQVDVSGRHCAAIWLKVKD